MITPFIKTNLIKIDGMVGKLWWYIAQFQQPMLSKQSRNHLYFILFLFKPRISELDLNGALKTADRFDLIALLLIKVDEMVGKL